MKRIIESMKEEFQKILRLRFDEKNRQLIGCFTQAKQRMNARGLLNSTETIKEMHQVLESEFIDSVTIVTDTAMDAMKRKNLLSGKGMLHTLCLDELTNRKLEIEGLFLSNSQSIRDGLQNTAMIEPYMSLDKALILQKEEMAIMLSDKMDKHLKDSGGNLLNIVKNRFFNVPIIVWGAIVVGFIIIIAKFTNALSKIQALFVN